MKILYVEDNEDDFLMVQDILTHSNERPIQIQWAQDLAEAHELLLKESEFDLILLDLSLPDSRGLETVTKIRRKKPKVPLVVLTGLDDEQTGLDSVRKGAQDYLIKGQTPHDYFLKAIFYAQERTRLENFRDDIVSNISHELRTPLTIIRESICQVSDGIFGKVNEEQSKYLNKSLTSIDRLKRIIDNLLDIAKIEEGKMEVFKEKINMVEVVQEIVFNFTPHMERKGLKISSHCSKDGIDVLADKEKLIQVLTNLIGNSYKFTNNGSIDIFLHDSDEEVICEVKDTGKGIPAKDLPRLFSKFDQIERTSGAGEKGTGLGLAIAKGIIELHNGTISVKSEKGKGTVFTFSLPKYPIERKKIQNIVLALQKVIASFNGFSLIVYSFSDGRLSEGSMGILEDLIRQGLHRKDDQVIKESDAIYAILPDTEKNNASIVAERINKIIEGNSWRKQLRDNLKFVTHVISYPQDGKTEDELIVEVNK